MQLEIREFLEYHPDGDRASHKSPSSRFEIYLVGECREVLLHTFNCFDTFHCSVAPRNKVIVGVREYVYTFAKAFGWGDIHRTFEKVSVTTETWQERIDIS